MLLSDSYNLDTSESVLIQADNVSSFAMLWVQTFSMKYNKSLITILKKTGPTSEPWGTRDIIFKKLL